MESSDDNSTEGGSTLIYSRDLGSAGMARARLAWLRYWWPHVSAVIALCALIMVSSFLWFELSSRFPQLPEGEYFGFIEGVWDQPASIPFYVRSSASGEAQLLVILREGCQYYTAPPASAGTDSKHAQIVTAGTGCALRISGKQINQESAEGRAVSLTSSREGSWKLSRLTDETSADRADLMAWLTQRAELLETERRIRGVNDERKKANDEIQRLNAFITEGTTLKARANEKFEKLQHDLNAEKELLKKRQSEVKVVEHKIELAQKVTPMGRLVSLARESLERENRWADALLKALPNGTAEQQTVESSVDAERAHLESEIESEQQRIALLVAAGQGGIQP